ncbi:unnamed protein product [Chrysoparadoxa australica]
MTAMLCCGGVEVSQKLVHVGMSEACVRAIASYQDEGDVNLAGLNLLERMLLGEGATASSDVAERIVSSKGLEALHQCLKSFTPAVVSSQHRDSTEHVATEVGALWLSLTILKAIMSSKIGGREAADLFMSCRGGSIKYTLSDLLRAGIPEQVRKAAAALLLCILAHSSDLSRKLKGTPLMDDLTSTITVFAGDSEMAEWTAGALTHLDQVGS